MTLTARHVVAYAMLAPPEKMGIRTIGGYLLGVPPSQVGIRTIGGYVLGPALKVLPLGVTGKQALLNMVVSVAKTVRPTTDFTVEIVEALAGDVEYNSRVKITALAGSGLRGSKWFRYNRIPVSRGFNDANNVPLSNVGTVHALLPDLNAASGRTYTADDFEDGPIGAGAPFVELTAKSTSSWFIPGTKVIVGKA